MMRDLISKIKLEFISVTDGDYNVSALLLILLVTFIVLYFGKTSSKYKLPPGPTGLPIVGYYPFLGKRPYKVLNELSKKYGCVFGLNLGRSFVVILGDYTAVKEAFSKSTTTDRPQGLFDFIPDEVGFSSLNGDDWIEQRKFALRAMRDIGLGRTRWEELVQEEVDDFVNRLYMRKGHPFDVSELLASSVANNISSLVFGKRIPVEDPARIKVDKSITAVSRTAKQASLRNFFPQMYKLLVKLNIGKYGKNHQVLVDFNNYIKKEIEERKKFMKKEDSDIFIDAYLKEIQNSGKNLSHKSFNEVNLRGNTQALIVGGSDTTMTSLNWLFVTMANFTDIQEKAHQEIESVLGKEGQAHWSERSKLPYTSAVIMECQRWMPIVPLNTARVPIEDITLGGYDIPKGTPIIANYWALHKDPKYWKNPDEFIPERFLSGDRTQLMSKQDSYLPFSYGRRNCPGETVAMIEILLYFAAVLQRFQVLPPIGRKPDLDGIQGITYHAVQQELRFLPRN